MKEIVKLQGIPKSIVSKIDPKFNSNFWKGFGTNMNLSTTYHPQTDGKIERVNQVIDYMLRMYVIDQPSKWKDYLYLVEFAHIVHIMLL